MSLEKGVTKSVSVAFLLAPSVLLSSCATRVTPRPDSYYDPDLRAYSELFKPGMTRADVEGSLNDRNTRFLRMCCVKEKRTALAVLVKIGSDKKPWYCSEHNIYVAFEFDAVTPPQFTSSLPSDVLQRVSIFHWYEGCL